MSSREQKKLDKEKRRLERLRKDLDAQQKKLDKEKAILRKDKIDIDKQRRKLATDQKMMKAKSVMLDTRSKSVDTRSPRGDGGSSKRADRKVKDLERDLADYKTKHEDKAKKVREQKFELDKKNAEIKSLKKKLKNAESQKGKGKGGDDGAAHEREMRNLRRQLLQALKDLDRQKRYYATQLKRFKEDQDRWLAKQRDMQKKKGFVVKYMFLDDIRAIKIYPKRDRARHKCRVKTSKGETVTLWIDDVKHFEPESDGMLSPAEDTDRDLDDFMTEMEDEFFPERAKRRKKKKKTKKLADGTEVPATPSTPYDSAFDFLDDDDMDAKADDQDDDIDDEYYAPVQIRCDMLVEELRARTADLHRVCEIYCEEPIAELRPALDELLKEVISRHEKWCDDMIANGFDEEDAPEISKIWEDEIGRIPPSVQVIVEKAIEAAVDRALEDAKAGGTVTDGDVTKLAKERDSLKEAAKQLMDELAGRLHDMQVLSAIYFKPEDVEDSEDDEEDAEATAKESLTPEQKKRKKRLKKLTKKLGARHTREGSTLHDLPLLPEEEIVDEFAVNNQEWRSVVAASSQSLEQSEEEAAQYVEELAERTKDLETVVKVVSGDEPLSALDERTSEAKDRHLRFGALAPIDEDHSMDADDEADDDEDGDVFVADNNHWRDLMDSLKKTEEDKRKRAAEDTAETDFREEALDTLLDEMKARRVELTEIRELDTTIPEECEAVYTTVADRHEAFKKKLREKKKLEADPAVSAKHDVFLEKIEEENDEWESAVKDTVKYEGKVKLMDKQEDMWLEELHGRINDIMRVQQLQVMAADPEKIAREDSEKTLESVKKEIKLSLASIVEGISDRHQDKEEKQTELYRGAELLDDERVIEHMEKFVTNDSDWRDAIGHFLEGSLSTIHEDDGDDKKAKRDAYLERLAGHTSAFDRASLRVMPMSTAGADDIDDIWWLDKDEDRCKAVDECKMITGDDYDDDDELLLVGGYLNTLFEEDDDPVRSLYTPQPGEERHHLQSALYDAELFCEFVALIDPDIIDRRVIHKPDPLEAYPITDEQVLENAQLLYSGLHALGCHLESEDPADWVDPGKHFEVLKEVVTELHHKLLRKYVDPKSDTALYNLQIDGEAPAAFSKLKSRDLIRRWMNQARGVKDLDAPVGEYSEDLYAALRASDEEFAKGAPSETFGEDPGTAAEYMIKYAKSKGVETTVTVLDLTDPNTYCQELFAAQVIGQLHGLGPISKEKAAEHGIEEKGTSRKKSKDEQACSFINAMLPEHLHVQDLARDLSDGVVLCYLVDKLKPGSITWKRVKKKVKNKFDMMGNCKYGMSVIEEEFKFSLVGISGQDIHEGKTKFIHTLLWQMMRYHTTKKLSELSTGGKEITDEDILAWANLTISGLTDRRCNTVKSLRDKHLTSCVYYLELLHAVLPEGTVRSELVYYDVPMLATSRAVDDFIKERLANARYAMTLIRMNGGELFVMPEDLVSLEQKAVLSVLASIMTIALTKKEGSASAKKPASKEADDAFDALVSPTTAED